MPARALLVLLVMLNFGVATWWLLRPEPPAPAPWAPPADVPRLQLLGEQVAVQADPGPGIAPVDGAEPPEAGAAAAEPLSTPDADAPAAVAQDASSVAPPPSPDAGPQAAAAATLRCSSFGPFPDAVSVAAARSALQPLGATRMRVRDVVEAPRGWRVVMAPQPDRAAADALAAKIREAGFDDLLVVPSGDEANGIALGRYGSEPSARRRESALRAAGFPAQAQPLGDTVIRHWLDVAAGPAFDAAAARAATAAAQVQDIECAGVVAAGASR
ncbi:SPOR domain-containing protein [Luteimonas sp. A649]